MAKPFLKWAGGKTQLLAQFDELYPAALKTGAIANYYEPFIGGGAVFFDIARKYPIKNAYLYDANEALIIAYKALRQDAIKLIDILREYQEQYHSLDDEKREDFYYKEREAHNNQKGDDFVRAARMIFLNKTCYNGLFRVNIFGLFNVPRGEHKKPLICDEENLAAIGDALQIADIKLADFESVENDIKNSSFVYFDPPYRPISKSASFNAYDKNGFSDVEQRRLADLFRRLDQKGAKIMLSNSDPKNTDSNDNFFDDLYKNYHIRRVGASRMINSKAAKRGAISEIIVTNY
ncbi:MAG: Dam family site-specific DNA-(adenine-N6)-methyltransferase [Helicobacteraceae bacterium]|jgi:DNA adenine methylase|nr:Dam family site-specific DNA-(adenine-N6)-methyltransferase [Helicobacteraceae bacterium]